MLAALMVLLTAGCAGGTAAAPTLGAGPARTPTRPAPIPEPTVVPGSAADAEAVRSVVLEFADAVAHDDELVVLLTLSPSAQHIAAASDLPAVFGWSRTPAALELQTINLDGDLALVMCHARFDIGEQPLRLRLLRLDGTWKIDGVQD